MVTYMPTHNELKNLVLYYDKVREDAYQTLLVCIEETKIGIDEFLTK